MKFLQKKFFTRLIAATFLRNDKDKGLIMSQVPRIYEIPEWEDPIRTDFLGKNPVKFVNSDGGWKECGHAHSLSSACVVIAASIFDEKTRNEEVECTICRQTFTEVIPCHEILESTLTITETFIDEKAVVTTKVTLEDGQELTVEGRLSEKVGDAYSGSKVKAIQEETHYEGIIETRYEFHMPDQDEPVNTQTDKKPFKSDRPYDVKPKVTVSYDQALRAWQADRETPLESLESLSSKTSETARPVLQEDWETQEYAPLVAALIEEYKGEDRDRGQLQLHIENARRIRDKVRHDLGLPLGYDPETPPLSGDVKPLHPSAKVDPEDSTGSADASQCCLAQLGAYNLVIASMVTSLLVIYGYSKGMFDNLIQNLRGSDETSMRQKNTVPIHHGPPATPFNPGGLGGISVYG